MCFVLTNAGFSVSMSADGSIVAFGGPADNSSLGAVWVFEFDVSAEGGEVAGDRLPCYFRSSHIHSSR